MMSSKLVSNLALFICIPSVSSCPSISCMLYRCLLHSSIFHVVCMSSMYYGSPVPNSLFYECIYFTISMINGGVLGTDSVGNEYSTAVSRNYYRLGDDLLEVNFQLISVPSPPKRLTTPSPSNFFKCKLIPCAAGSHKDSGYAEYKVLTINHVVQSVCPDGTGD